MGCRTAPHICAASLTTNCTALLLLRLLPLLRPPALLTRVPPLCCMKKTFAPKPRLPMQLKRLRFPSFSPIPVPHLSIFHADSAAAPLRQISACSFVFWVFFFFLRACWGGETGYQGSWGLLRRTKTNHSVNKQLDARELWTRWLEMPVNSKRASRGGALAELKERARGRVQALRIVGRSRDSVRMMSDK